MNLFQILGCISTSDCSALTRLDSFPFGVMVTGKEDGKSCQKVTVRMTIRKNDCRSNRPVRSLLPLTMSCSAALTLCAAGEHRVLRWEVSVRQHLQLQHQHVRPLLQVLQRDGAAAPLCAALLQQQLHLGQLQHPGAHRLLLPVVLKHPQHRRFSCTGFPAGREVVLKLTHRSLHRF